MDLQNFHDVDWTAPEDFLATLRGVSQHWIMSSLMDIAYYLMAQGVAGRLAPMLEQEQRRLCNLEEEHQQKQSEWEAAQRRMEAAKAEMAQLLQPPMLVGEHPVRHTLSQASREAARLATELARLDEMLKQQRPKVQGMRAVMDRLLAISLPELGGHLGLAEFLASLGDADSFSL